MNGKKTLYPIWLAALGIFLLAGLYTTAILFREGHWLFHANDVIVWSLPLCMYIFLALSSSGLALLSSLPTLFGINHLAPYAKRLVFLSLATLCGGFLAIALELGAIGHMFHFIISPNMRSPIWWMGTLYTTELVFLGVKFRCLHTDDGESGLSKTAGALSFLCAVAAPMLLGGVFGITESRAVYFGPMFSIFYLAMALFSGTALFILYNTICNTLAGRTPSLVDDGLLNLFTYSTGALVVITVLKSAVEFSTVIPEFIALRTFNHPFRLLFGFPMEVVLGLFTPFLLLMIPSVQKNSNGTLFTALLAWVGSLAIHLRLLITGQSYPVGPKAEQFPEILAYVPSLWEGLIALFALAAMLLIYTLGERFLKLEPSR